MTKSESSSRKRKAGAVASLASKAEDLAAHEDAMAILNAVVEFRSKNNRSIPTPSTMEPLLSSIKDSLHEKLTSVDQLYNKFRGLKRRYRNACERGVGPSPSDRAFYDLSVKAWGEEKEKEKEKKKGKKEKTANIPMDVDDDDADEAEEEEEVGDGSNAFKHLAAGARKSWPHMGLPTEILKLGLHSIDKRKAAVLEKKWGAFLEVALKNTARSHELNREICTSLLDGLKSKRSS